jgi:hypothetical protein
LQPVEDHVPDDHLLHGINCFFQLRTFAATRRGSPAIGRPSIEQWCASSLMTTISPKP